MMRPSITTLALLFVPVAAGSTPALAEPVARVAASQDSLGDLTREVESKRDDVDPEVLSKIADLGTRESMEALLAAYEQLSSTYMRRIVLRRLSDYDELEDAFQPALEHLANIAASERISELRASALEGLGRCREHGKIFLAKIVESPAMDSVRERAMRLHLNLGGEDDLEWYRKIYSRTTRKAMEEAGAAEDDKKGKKKRKKKKKKGQEEPPVERKEIVWPTVALKSMALEAILPSLKDEELAKDVQNYIGRADTAPIARTAFRELARRDSKLAKEFAEQILERPDFRGADRAMAAKVIVDDRGADAAKDLIEIAKKPTTQVVLRNALADLLVEMDDEKVNKLLIKLVGKGKGHQKAFAIRATRHISDEKFVKKIRKGIRDKDPVVAIATIGAIADRKDREAIADLEKLFEKTKDEDVREAVLRGLSSIYDGENSWVERLVALGGREEMDLRNAALNEIARLGRRTTVELFKERLAHPDWTTRLIALRALEGQRDPALVGPIVEQMQSEAGRMAIEFGATLFRLTGEPFGRNPGVWKRWFDKEGSDLKLIEPSELESLVEAADERRLKQVSGAEFFGIKIESHRIAFVVDVSGSMQEPTRGRYVNEPGRPRIDVAIEELTKAIDALEDNALFNVYPFSGGVESWIPGGVEATREATREDAKEYVGRLGPFGGTNLFGGLEAAFEDADVDTIFVLSDGEPSVGDIIDPQLIRETIQQMNQTRNVEIHTVSIGLDLEILRWLAEDTGGTYVQIP